MKHCIQYNYETVYQVNRTIMYPSKKEKLQNINTATPTMQTAEDL